MGYIPRKSSDGGGFGDSVFSLKKTEVEAGLWELRGEELSPNRKRCCPMSVKLSQLLMNFLFSAALVLSLVACGAAEESVCEPGRQVSCACPGAGGEGVQACLSDGSGWGPCDCGDDAEPSEPGSDDDPSSTDPTDETDPSDPPQPMTLLRPNLPTHRMTPMTLTHRTRLMSLTPVIQPTPAKRAMGISCIEMVRR